MCLAIHVHELFRIRERCFGMEELEWKHLLSHLNARGVNHNNSLLDTPNQTEFGFLLNLYFPQRGNTHYDCWTLFKPWSSFKYIIIIHSTSFLGPTSPWLPCGSLVSGTQHLPGQDGVPVMDQGEGELSQSLHWPLREPAVPLETQRGEGTKVGAWSNQLTNQLIITMMSWATTGNYK